MVRKHHLQNCDDRSSNPLRARNRLKSGQALKRACARYSKGPSRKAFRIVAATAALVLGLLDALPVHAATESRVVFHNWGRDEQSNGYLVDDYENGVSLNSDNPVSARSSLPVLLLKSMPFDPYVDAYLLTRISLSIRNLSSNAGGMAFTAGIYLVDEYGRRDTLVQYMNSDGVIGKDKALRVYPV